MNKNKKITAWILIAASASACMQATEGDDSRDEAPAVIEGTAVGTGSYVELEPAQPSMLGMSSFDSRTLYRGLVLADGPVADIVPTIRDHLRISNNITDKKALAQARGMLDAILDLVAEKDPDYLESFRSDVQSGDALRIAGAVENGKMRARDALELINTKDGNSLDDKCVVLAVVVAIFAANVVVAVNHAFAYDTAYVTGVEDPDRLSIDEQSFSLLSSEAAAEVSSMTQVPVWEFSAIDAYTRVVAYTAKTKHQLVLGDFDGDGVDDRFYYQPGGSNDELVATQNGQWTANMDLTATPIVGDFDGDNVDDIFWWNKSSDQHYIWFFNKTSGVMGYTFLRYSSANTRPIVGDFNNDGRSDIFWYAAGSAQDKVWFISAARGLATYAGAKIQISGTGYNPLAGDFWGDNADEILWYKAGSRTHQMWKSNTVLGNNIVANRDFTVTVNGSYSRPFVGDFDRNGKDDIFWYAPGSTGDVVWYWAADGTWKSYSHSIDATYRPVVGTLNASTGASIFWWPSR